MSDSFKYIPGTNASERIDGTDGRDWIVAKSGNDTVYAWGGADHVEGGPGNDKIIGGEGADVLFGGPGADIFRYYSGSETRGDAIWDFNPSQGDKIDLHAIDAKDGSWSDPTTWGNEDFQWMGAIGSKQELGKGELGFRYVGSDTYVYGNTNDNSSTYEVNMKLHGHVNLHASDFYL